MREHRAGLEKGNANADTAEIGGRLPRHTERARVRELEDIKSDDRSVLVRRGSGDGMGAKESCRNTGSPCKRSGKAQTGIPRGTGLACVGGGEARSSEDARNERRAKGPQFQGNATSGARAEIGASLRPAEKLWKLQETLHAKSMKSPWSESRMRETRTSGLMSGGVETGPPKETAPPLDSTYRAKRHLAIREAMGGKAERDPRRERARARDQAVRSDNTASHACRFEVSAEQPSQDAPFSTETHNLLSSKLL